MARKDYVRRGQTKNSRPKKKPATSKAPKSSRLTLLLTLFVVGVFGYGLYWLSQNSEPKAELQAPKATQNLNQPNKKPPAKTTKEAVSPIPPPRVEKWDYVDSLPKREVQVQAKEQPKSTVPYIMQCGAYKSMGQAESRKIDIAFQGLASQIRKQENSDWFRVVLGPYATKREAERDKHKLQRAKIEPCAIWAEN